MPLSLHAGELGHTQPELNNKASSQSHMSDLRKASSATRVNGGMLSMISLAVVLPIIVLFVIIFLKFE